MVKVGDKAHNFQFEEIAMIVEARVEELLEYVDKELHKIKRSRKLPGGIVLTGGTSKMPGIDEFARDKLATASSHRQAPKYRRPSRHSRGPRLHDSRRLDAARHAFTAGLCHPCMANAGQLGQSRYSVD